MPSARYTHHVEIPVPPVTAWELLQLPETWASLGAVDRVWDPAHENGVLRGYRWQGQAGPRTVEGTARTVEAAAPERMRVDLDAGDFTGSLTVRLSPNGGRTTGLEVELAIRTDSLLMSALFPLISGVIEREFPGQVDGFADRVRAGA